MRKLNRHQNNALRGKAFLFEGGQSSYLSGTAAAMPNLSPGVGNLSVEFWFRPLITLNASFNIIGNGAYTNAGADTVGWAMFTSNTGLLTVKAADGTDTTQVQLAATNAFILNQWTHVLVNFDRLGNMSIFLNGIANGTASIALEPLTWNTTADFSIGCRKNAAGGTTLFHTMAINQIGIWQRLQTADEILQAARGRNLGMVADRSNLVAWWDAKYGLLDPISVYRLTNNANVVVVPSFI